MNVMEYEDPKHVNKPTRASLHETNKKMLNQVVNDCSTARILLSVARKHASGLKTFAIFGLVGYIAYDKVITLFV